MRRTAMADETTPQNLGRAAVVLRLGAIGAVVAVAGGGFAYAGGWLSPGTLTQARIIDQFEQDNGVHAGFRRNHAKGICVSGFFEGNGKASALSKAQLFAPGRIPVIGRFALAGGQPYAADAALTVRSMALRFTLPDGEEWRTGMNNIPVFAVNTPQGFYYQLVASKPDPATGKNYLFDDLIAALGRRPLQWHLVVTVGQPGDPTNDATIAWPSGRQTVDAGTLTIDHVEGEASGPCRDLNFDPLVLPSGIEPSDDPLLSARSAAYSQSFTRRAGEAKQPSAVTTPARPEGKNS
jgi:catalase